MSETDPKTGQLDPGQAQPGRGEAPAESAQGSPVGATVCRVIFFLVAGTGLFYYLGKLSAKVQGVEQAAERTAQEREAAAGAPERGPRTAIPDLPQMKPYPNALSYSGGGVFLLNGIPRRIATFTTSDSPDAVAEWYVAAWRDVGLSPIGDGDETWASATAVNLQSSLRHSIMAQWVAESRTTIAHLSVGTLAPLDAEFKQTHLPLPEGSVPLMDVRSADAGAPGTMVAYLLPMSTGSARAHMLEKLRETGWRFEETYSHPMDKRGWCVLFFSHGDRLLTLTLDPVADGKTSMVVTESVDLQ